MQAEKTTYAVLLEGDALEDARQVARDALLDAARQATSWRHEEVSQAPAKADKHLCRMELMCWLEWKLGRPGDPVWRHDERGQGYLDIDDAHALAKAARRMLRRVEREQDDNRVGGRAPNDYSAAMIAKLQGSAARYTRVLRELGAAS